MKSFAAIDFETANRYPSSVCSVGIVIVKDGIIVDRIYRLIHPYPHYYNFMNTRIHGLSYQDTMHAPTFPTVWKEIESLIEGLPLIAHNSPFDRGCLIAAFDHYKMEYPSYKFYCTCRAARKIFPYLPNHRLKTVALHCGYNLENHHHALADAEACAEIAIRVL